MLNSQISQGSKATDLRESGQFFCFSLLQR